MWPSWGEHRSVPHNCLPCRAEGWGKRPTVEGSFRKLGLRFEADPPERMREACAGGQSPVTPGAAQGKLGQRCCHLQSCQPHTPGWSDSYPVSGKALITFYRLSALMGVAPWGEGLGPESHILCSNTRPGLEASSEPSFMVLEGSGTPWVGRERQVISRRDAAVIEADGAQAHAGLSV